MVQVPSVGRSVAQVKQYGEWGALPTVGEPLGKSPGNAVKKVGQTVRIQKSSVLF